jgi:simple sugar transport system permease protein
MLLGAAGELIQRRMELPDATILVLQGMISTSLIFVSLGETITERAGRVNIGLGSTLVFGAMSAYAVAFMSGSPWLGLPAAFASGVGFGSAHAFICKFRHVNDIAIGIALMLLGTGLAFFFGKAFIQPSAPHLPSIPLGLWSDIPQLRAALAMVFWWAFRDTRIGPILRIVSDSSDAARALGVDPMRFGVFAALDDVSIRIAAGSFHALLGENGAGKSTLLNACWISIAPPTARSWSPGARRRSRARATPRRSASAWSVSISLWRRR